MPALTQLPALVVEDPRGRRPLPVPRSRDGALLGDQLTGLGSLPHDFEGDPLTFLGGARHRSPYIRHRGLPALHQLEERVEPGNRALRPELAVRRVREILPRALP